MHDFSTGNQYQWDDGSVLDYVNYGSGNTPDGGCIVMDISDAGGGQRNVEWRADDCGADHGYLCRAPKRTYLAEHLPPNVEPRLIHSNWPVRTGRESELERRQIIYLRLQFVKIEQMSTYTRRLF